jgi:hypothetical protein
MLRLLQIVCSENSTTIVTLVGLTWFVVGMILFLCMLVFSRKATEVIVDDLIFNNHAEKEFWERVVAAALNGGNPIGDALTAADLAVDERRGRMVKIAPKAKAA